MTKITGIYSGIWEINGVYNTAFREYDANSGRWLSLDPKPTASESWYAVMWCNPVNNVDWDGDVPLLVNGRVSEDSERGDISYWGSTIIATISRKTKYSIDKFLFFDGDKAIFADTRENNEKKTRDDCAYYIFFKLKTSKLLQLIIILFV